MANQTIDLRRLKNELKGTPTPENELPPPAEKQLLETEEAAHPEGFDDYQTRHPAILEWMAPEFERNESNALILLLLGAALALGGIITAFFKNFLFAVFLFVAGGLVISYAFKNPRQVLFAVTPRGIKIGGRLYEFEDLHSFWIFYDPPLFKELSLRSKKSMMPMIRLPLGELDPLRMREILLRFLPEEKQEAQLVDIISKRLGF